MRRNLINQKGFTLVESLLVVIALALVIFVGYYVWHSQKQTDKTLNTASQNSQSNSSNVTKKSGTATQNYLTIKEWGVKMLTSADSKDAYYSFSDNSNQQFLDLDSHDLDALKAYDGSSCTGEYIATLGRYQKGDPSLNDPSVVGPIAAQKTVGAQVYTFATKKEYASACLYDANNNPIEANTAVYDKKVSAYTTMFDTIRAQ